MFMTGVNIYQVTLLIQRLKCHYLSARLGKIKLLGFRSLHIYLLKWPSQSPSNSAEVKYGQKCRTNIKIPPKKYFKVLLLQLLLQIYATLLCLS